MILILNVCKEKLHYLEFVRPIENILKEKNIIFQTTDYKKLDKGKLKKYEKIIICGTSLKDNEYLKNIKKFDWIKKIKVPVLGICSGMQIIGLIFGGKLKNKTEIGFYNENLKENFLGLRGVKEVYHLHNNYVNLSKNFKKFTNSKIPQAIKYKDKIYGVLFHPEVRNKELILNFIKK